MPCAFAHRAVAGVGIGIAMAHQENKAGTSTPWPVIGGGLGALLGTLPDIIEPALHPNHRQVFHSVACYAGLAYLARRLYVWEPTNERQQVMRKMALIAISAYLIHLSMDALTSKSLPLVGKI